MTARRYLTTILLVNLLAACASEVPDPGLADAGVDGQPAPTGKGLIILTSKTFASRSRVLPRFVAAKERRNLRVLVATEETYGGEAVAGQERALRIRAWLREVAGDYDYLLLVGDGHPEYGDVPMLTVWPRHAQPEEVCLQAFPIDCRSLQTDAFYADLRGEWDRNGNGRYGEHELDDGEGGIDFSPELVVGRIPVYFDEVSEGDRILEHALAYMAQGGASAVYRRSVLLPAAFLYFKGQRLAAMTSSVNFDGADSLEWMVANVLRPRPELTFHRLYEREGVVTSRFASEGALSQESVIAEWSRGQGFVFWSGHGLPSRVARTVWREDANANGIAEGDEMISPPLLRSQEVSRIPAGQAAFAVGLSCEIGSADVPYNLSHSLLLAGAAVGVVGSSSVTPGSEMGDPAAPLDQAAYGANNVAVTLYQGLLDGRPGGEVFAETRVTLGTSGSSEAYAGKMMLNYFGDPTLTLVPEGGWPAR